MTQRPFSAHNVNSPHQGLLPVMRERKVLSPYSQSNPTSHAGTSRFDNQNIARDSVISRPCPAVVLAAPPQPSFSGLGSSQNQNTPRAGAPRFLQGNFVRQLLASSSSLNAPSTSAAPPRFIGEREVSNLGKHEILRYKIPDSTQCFVYIFHKKCKFYDLYVCRGCKKERIHNQIEVVGNQFQSDPCRHQHRCISVNTVQDKVERRTHQKSLAIREDPRYRKCTTTEILEDMLEEYQKDRTIESAEEREEMMLRFHRGNLDSRRSAITKSKAVHRVRGMNWDNIPESFSHLEDNTRFLQVQTQSLHIYYSQKTIEKAYRNGLHALVADGVHKVLPEQLGDHSQLYTIHGVCNNGLEVPLLHALTRNKTEATYRTIFGRLTDELVALGGLPSLRLVVDFETAAIRAARAVFPSVSVEGCAFHLAQAWNRKRDSLGLRRYLVGPHRSRPVLKWWRLIKGLPFLPKHLHRRLPGLNRPSIPLGHEAYQKCEEFLGYLHTTWMRGPYADLWCKWGITELRTTNLAEAYHSKLRRIFKKKNVDLEVVLGRIRASNTRAFGDLCALERLPDVERRLRRRDRERRIKVAREMRRFARELRRACVTTSTIIKYCRRMSRFISEKSI